MPTTHHESDEISLSEVFNSTSKGFKSLLEKSIDLIALIRKKTIAHIYLFAIVFIVFTTTTFSYYYIKKDMYSGHLLVKSESVDKYLFKSIISELNFLAKKKDKPMLAEVLGIDSSKAKAIDGFSSESFLSQKRILEIKDLKAKIVNSNLDDKTKQNLTQTLETSNHEDLKAKIVNSNLGNKIKQDLIQALETSNHSDLFKITIITKEQLVIHGLDSAIREYFLRNPYLKKRIKINTETLLKRKNKLIKEQVKIDSLKQSIFQIYKSIKNNRHGSDNVILTSQEIVDPLEVFKEGFNINELILNIERELFLKKEFEIVQGAPVFEKQGSILSLEFIFHTILSVIGTAYVLIILIELNKFLAERGIKDQAKS